ncbi:porin [Chitinibacter bivalviorum]|uniref:Porin n=1 Tax=Chitinibacter bivalviorum TaxID=2739434 RepID=A0A7H9BQL6_9NEIS|nr:porin [Chitinibacter bivalviorum]QLG89534.1 porin [Chitinibacter bivalviorum]
MKLKATFIAFTAAFVAMGAQADVMISGDVTGALKYDDIGSENANGVYLDGTIGLSGSHKVDSINGDLIWNAALGINTTNGTGSVDDWLTAKDLYVGARGNYGMLRLGRTMTPSYEAQDNLFTDTGLSWLAGDYGVGQGARVNNIVRYDSPVMAGFKVGAAYAFKNYSDDGAGDGTTYDVAAQYKWSGLQVDATYQQRNGVTEEVDTYGYVTNDSTFDSKTYYAGLRYEFQNGFGLTGGYKSNEYNPGTELKQDQWLAQASYKKDKHAVYLSYANLSNIEQNGVKQADSGAQAVAVRYNYSLDKNQIAFVEGRYVKNEANSAIGAGDNAMEYSGTPGQDTARLMTGVKVTF